MLASKRRVFFPLLVFAFSFSCAKAEQPKATNAISLAREEPKQAVHEVAVASEEAPTYESIYTYSPIGRSDPFKPFIDPGSGHDTGTTALQKWEIDQLRLTAVVMGTAAPFAMIQDPTGLGHIVRRGTLVGKNWGRIMEITERQIIVREEYRAYNGTKVENEIPLTIPKLPRPTPIPI